MTLEEIRERLADVESALDSGNYRKGMWQGLLREASILEADERRSLAEAVSRVSRKLHGRKLYPHAPFGVAIVLECVLLAISIYLLGQAGLVAVLAGAVGLALTLQPTLKVAVGLLMGVRYEYAFLWYIEPRFKMRYGTYFVLEPSQRIAFHLAGSVGTPVAMLIGAVQLMPISALLGYLCLVLAAGALAMQVGAFIAQWIGINRIAGFQLSTLTSPATAAFEWRHRNTRQSMQS